MLLPQASQIWGWCWRLAFSFKGATRDGRLMAIGSTNTPHTNFQTLLHECNVRLIDARPEETTNRVLGQQQRTIGKLHLGA